MESVTDFSGDVRKQIIEFSNSPEYRQLSSFYRQKSFFEALNIQRKETCHSSFLAWLLDPDEFHGVGSTSLQKLLEVCALVLSETKQKPPPHLPATFFDDVIANRCTFSKTRVTTEKSIVRVKVVSPKGDLIGVVAGPRSFDQPFLQLLSIEMCI